MKILGCLTHIDTLAIGTANLIDHTRLFRGRNLVFDFGKKFFVIAGVVLTESYTKFRVQTTQIITDNRAAFSYKRNGVEFFIRNNHGLIFRFIIKY